MLTAAQCHGNRVTAQGLDNYGSEAIYSVGASVGLSESSNSLVIVVACDGTSPMACVD